MRKKVRKNKSANSEIFQDLMYIICLIRMMKIEFKIIFPLYSSFINT